MTTCAIKDIKNSLHPIFIGPILTDAHLLSSLANQTACIISEENVAPLLLQATKDLLQQHDVHHLILPAGEQHKSWQQLGNILAFLSEKNFDRSVTLIALGGGVITDLTGLAASLYRRGTPWIAVPTSLLSQADAAIGGKTAINFQTYKNMLGTFHLPKAILIDPITLQTLPQREYFSGFAEVIKHAILSGEEFFSWLEENALTLCQKDFSSLTHMLYKSIQVKTALAEQDIHDHQQRHLLNLGHSIGHAIEATSKQPLLHGEAIAIGLILELQFAQKYLSISLPIERITALLKQFHLPTQLPKNVDQHAIHQHLLHDKKTTHQNIKIPLVHAIGDVKLHTIAIDQLSFL